MKFGRLKNSSAQAFATQPFAILRWDRNMEGTNYNNFTFLFKVPNTNDYFDNQNSKIQIYKQGVYRVEFKLILASGLAGYLNSFLLIEPNITNASILDEVISYYEKITPPDAFNFKPLVFYVSKQSNDVSNLMFTIYLLDPNNREFTDIIYYLNRGVFTDALSQLCIFKIY